MMRMHTVDFRDRDNTWGARVNRGWHVDTPRVILLCRLRGHRPVVDGVDIGGKPSRWVCCDRCGTRLLQPVDGDLAIGQPYTLPLPPHHTPDGTIRGQIILGRSHSGWSVGVAVGCQGDEPLSGHIHLGNLAAFYLVTEGHGAGLQRRLNPDGYDARCIQLRLHNASLWWQLWARESHSSTDDPWWMRGYVTVDPREWIWGPRRYRYENVGDPVQATVRMPHGDDHPVTLQLRRCSHGRDRARRRTTSWVVDCETAPGIPIRPDGRSVQGLAVDVSDVGVERGLWPAEACAAIAAELARDRSRYGYRPVERVS